MSTALRTFILSLFIGCLGLFTVSCEKTIEGAGDDIEEMGDDIEDATD